MVDVTRLADDVPEGLGPWLQLDILAFCLRHRVMPEGGSLYPHAPDEVGYGAPDYNSLLAAATGFLVGNVRMGP